MGSGLLASPNPFKFAFAFVYTVIKTRAIRTSLDKKLNAEEFHMLSHGEACSS